MVGMELTYRRGFGDVTTCGYLGKRTPVLAFGLVV